jgi:bifunctional DNA-binding transcriptional regulator/antitoxin component of YhaV-PrlF toxin-antitoxin module
VSSVVKPVDNRSTALQRCSMTAIPVSKRGTVTLPPEIRRSLGLDTTENPMVLVEEREGGVFLLPAAAVPVRNIPESTLRKWIAEDERGAEAFWKNAGKA